MERDSMTVHDAEKRVAELKTMSTNLLKLATYAKDHHDQMEELADAADLQLSIANLCHSSGTTILGVTCRIERVIAGTEVKGEID